MSRNNQFDGVIELSPEIEDNKFRISSKSAIQDILQVVMQRNVLVALHFGHDNDYILTSILAIDPELQGIVVDFGEAEKLSKVTLDTKEVIFVTSQDQSKIQFTCTAIRKIQFEGRNAFSIDLPDSILHIKKRQYYQITEPSRSTLKCFIPLSNEYNSNSTEIAVHDISCGGITLIEQNSLVNFECGVTYKNCQIDLPGVGTLNITIKIMSTYKVTLDDGLICKHAGCEFINSPQDMLEMVRQYISKLKQAEIKQAITENRFKVNPEAVADRLLETVRELIRSRNNQEPKPNDE